jgi:2-dehydro-3-deoxy-D-arabinonate dehydratase
MDLTRHRTKTGPRWAADGKWLPEGMDLRVLLAMSGDAMRAALAGPLHEQPAAGERLAPIDTDQEVWAAGVTYLRSREARMAESRDADIYAKVYDAERPELFSKSIGWRVRGDGEPIRIRRDSGWNVPEPELVLVINRFAEIVGYCAGNDVSSRDIEGENPLYLPQAKTYDGSCVLGPSIRLCGPLDLVDLPIRLEIEREGQAIFTGSTRTSRMKRSLEALVAYLVRELEFPHGVFLMTGTGLVPEGDFTMLPGDIVTIGVGELALRNRVRQRREV